MSRDERVARILQMRGLPLPVDLIARLLDQGIDPDLYS
jgi:hypothetical protein